MDGIALAAERTYAASETSPVRLVVPGDAFWVDTGDPIPQGCSVVVPSEELHWREDGSVEIHGPSAPWEHVRVTGQEIATGEMVLPSGWLIGSGRHRVAAGRGADRRSPSRSVRGFSSCRPAPS